MSKGRNASTAVLARRRGKDDNEGLTEKERLWKQLDFFATPPFASRAGLERARKLWHTGTPLHLIEPAAGMGHIFRPAREYFDLVDGFDVHDHGAGFERRDWLDESAWPEDPCCDIVCTNPPFQIADRFVTLGLKRARLGVALLLRLAFVEAAGRYTLLAGPTAKLTQMAIFSERVPMTLGSWDPAASSATAYAWFYWSKVHDPMPPMWFPPGTRDRLWRPDDPALFGKREPMPLFPADDLGDVI